MSGFVTKENIYEATDVSQIRRLDGKCRAVR